MDAAERNKGLEYARPITVGDNVWFGAGVSVLPGVTIGDNCVIGAGSVVVKDIPSNSVAVGNPCKVIKTIINDKNYSYAPLSPLEYNRVPVVITDESGINDVVGGSSSVRYNPGSRSIVVIGTKEGEEVTLFDAAGRELIRTVASADTFDISLAGIPAGVSIVMAGGKAYKINCR